MWRLLMGDVMSSRYVALPGSSDGGATGCISPHTSPLCVEGLDELLEKTCIDIETQVVSCLGSGRVGRTGRLWSNVAAHLVKRSVW